LFKQTNKQKNIKILIGEIGYFISKEHEPYFSNMEELKENEKAFSTIPVYLKFGQEPEKKIILSGETIDLNDIYCKKVFFFFIIIIYLYLYII